MRTTPDIQPSQAKALIETKLEQMRPRFLSAISGRLVQIETLRDGPKLDQDPLGVLQTIRAIAHKIIGMAEPMGYQDLGDLCRKAQSAIDALLESNEPDHPQFVAALNAIDDMLGEMALLIEPLT